MKVLTRRNLSLLLARVSPQVQQGILGNLEKLTTPLLNVECEPMNACVVVAWSTPLLTIPED